MNKRGSIAKLLISFYYIVLAVAVFWLLYSNLNGMISGTALAKNAFLKDSSTIIDSLLLVDENPGKRYTLSYDVPQRLTLKNEKGLIKTAGGETIEYNKPEYKSFEFFSSKEGNVLVKGSES